MGLYDAVLIKDNHLAAISSFTNEAASWLERIKQAIAKIRNDHPDITVQVEVDTLQQLEKVILLRPDLILLDNMSLEDMKTAVAIRGGLEIELEASGGIDLQTVRAIAETGVERISVGALTHSAINFDWGLDWQT